MRPRPARGDSAASELRHRIHQQLIDELGPILFDVVCPRTTCGVVCTTSSTPRSPWSGLPLSAADKARLIQEVSDDILGYGPIDSLLKDDDVSEIMVNGPDRVFVERSGKLARTDAINSSTRTTCAGSSTRSSPRIGRRIDESTPMVDARLPDGSRVNAVISPLAIGGPFLTIRKVLPDPLQIDDLIRYGSLNAHTALASCRPASSAV